MSVVHIYMLSARSLFEVCRGSGADTKCTSLLILEMLRIGVWIIFKNEVDSDDEQCAISTTNDEVQMQCAVALVIGRDAQLTETGLF